MNKALSLVALIASASLGELITIDLPSSTQSWDHANAVLIGVDVASYIKPNQDLISAKLQFTGVQNYMEREKNDWLWINLLKYNSAIAGQTTFLDIPDAQAGRDVLGTNYFTVTKGNPAFELVTELQYYNDNNDYTKEKQAIEQKVLQVSYWEQTEQYKAESATMIANGYYWQYDFDNPGWHGNGQRVYTDYVNGTYSDGYYEKGINWVRYSNWTTEDFDRVLDVTTVKNLMASSNGKIGVGLDADCLYGGKVQLVIETKTNDVPEPSSFSLMLLGLTSLGGAFFMRKRK